jgi:hypothetical protein
VQNGIMWHRIRQVKSFCEHCSQRFGFVNGGEFLDLLNVSRILCHRVSRLNAEKLIQLHGIFRIMLLVCSQCLCGLVVSVEDYKHRGPGFDYRALLRIFLRELGLERGPLRLVIG